MDTDPEAGTDTDTDTTTDTDADTDTAVEKKAAAPARHIRSLPGRGDTTASRRLLCHPLHHTAGSAGLPMS